jgi:hypothetical protein
VVFHTGANKINLKNSFLVVFPLLAFTFALFLLLLNLQMSLFNLSERLFWPKKHREGFVLHRVNLEVLQNHVEVVVMLFLKLTLPYVTGLKVNYQKLETDVA